MIQIIWSDPVTLAPSEEKTIEVVSPADFILREFFLSDREIRVSRLWVSLEGPFFESSVPAPYHTIERRPIAAVARAGIVARAKVSNPTNAPCIVRVGYLVDKNQDPGREVDSVLSAVRHWRGE